jgi:ComF family protein
MTQAIASLKYEERSEFAARLVKTGFDSIRPLEWEGAALVPVPIHPLRLVERGYNQASLLARALGKYWKMPVIYQALVRHKFVVRQVGLGRAARAENAAHAFMLGKKSLLGRRVVLVDDVVTTGATLASCQKVLQEGGATVLGVTAVARADSQIQGYDREGVSRNEGVKSAVLGLGL